MDDFLDIAVLWLISFLSLEVIGGWIGIIVAIITGIAMLVRTIQSFKKRKEEHREHLQRTREHLRKEQEYIQKEKEHIQRTEKNELEIQLLRKQLGEGETKSK